MFYNEHLHKLRDQLYDYLSGLQARIRFSNGGGSNLEVRVTPALEGRKGVFLYMIDHHSEPGSTRLSEQMYFRLTSKNARRLAHALLFIVGETEVEDSDEVLTPEVK